MGRRRADARLTRSNEAELRPEAGPQTFVGHMTRLLSIVLLASFFAGFLAPGAQSSEAVAAQAVSSHNGHSGMAMAADCSACPMPGACIAATAKEPFGSVPSRLHPMQPSSRHPDRLPTPDTAPPKRFSF